MPENALLMPLSLGIAYVVILLVCLLAGRAQRREVAASIGRLWAVAALFAMLVFVPAIPALLLGGQIDLSWTEQHYILTEAELEQFGTEVREVAIPFESEGTRFYRVPVEEPLDDRIMRFGAGYSGWYRPVNLLILLLAMVTVFKMVFAGLRPVRRALKIHDELPVIDDPGILERVGWIAERMGARTPRVLSLASTSGVLEMQAVTGGTLAPVLIATNGVLGRLQDDETTAILAHEIGHIARRSLLGRLLLVVVIESLTVVISGFLFPTITIALGCATLLGLLKITGQFDELACDLRAARAVGFAAMSRALGKVHAANSVPCGPALLRIVHATQTHPSEAVRLANLARHAPDDQGSELSYDRREVELQRRTNYIVLGVFAALLGFGVWAGLDENLKWFGVAGLLAVVLLPLLFALLAVFKPLLYMRRLGYLVLPWGRVLRFTLYVGGVWAALVGLGEPGAWPTWIALALCVGMFAIGRRRTRQIARITQATRTQEFQRALELYDRLPHRVRRRPQMRLMRATLLAADRCDQDALDELEALARDRPRYWPGQLLRCQITSWGEPELALGIAESIDLAVPNNPWPLSYRAVCLARLGRFEEAMVMARRGLELDPSDGSLHVLLATVASRSGDVALAEELIRVGEARDPASTVLFFVKARVHLAKGDLESAAEAIRDAEQAVENNRMSLLMSDLDVLKQRYRELSARS